MILPSNRCYSTSIRTKDLVWRGRCDGDGRDDFYVGGGRGYAGQLHIQLANGTFVAHELTDSKAYEDTGAVVRRGPGWRSGPLRRERRGRPPGGQPPLPRPAVYQRRAGELHRCSTALPRQAYSGAAVVAADYDHDGDLDLFVAGRTTLPSFPQPERSVLLRNESSQGSVRFRDVTDELLPGVNQTGILSAAVWSDFNQDGWPDLVLAGAWMPLTFFENQRGTFQGVTDRTGLASTPAGGTA